MARLRLHIHLDDQHSLGPGKVELLEGVGRHGSIAAAARGMGMSYRHAWELVDDVNRAFGRPVVAAESGGPAGGGARLTAFGEELVRRFRAMESAASAAIAPELRALRGAPRRQRRRRR